MPAESVLVSRLTDVEVSMSETLAFATKAPDASVIVPWMVPDPAIWALTLVASRSATTQEKTIRQRRIAACFVNNL